MKKKEIKFIALIRGLGSSVYLLIQGKTDQIFIELKRPSNPNKNMSVLTK